MTSTSAPPAAAPAPPAAGGLRRTLGTADLTLIVVGLVIGSGIFLVPSLVLRNSGGSIPIATGVWLVGGVLSFLGALSYAELGAMNGEAGGLYAYIRDGFGRFPAFLYGWTLFFVTASGSIATLAVAATNYLGQFLAFSPLQAKLVAVALILVMMVINVLGTRGSATVANTATAIKVIAILAMSAVLFALGDADAAAAAATTPPLPPATLAGVGLSLVAVLWAYEGWQYVTFSAGEARDPQRSLPKAIALGTGFLVLLYLLANFAYLAALSPARIAASDRVASEAMEAVLGPGAGTIIALAIIVSMYSAGHAIVITAPRVYYQMARDGVFFRRLADVHPRWGTPAVAIVANCAVAAVLAISGTFETLLTYVIFVGWIFYALGAGAVIALRRKRPDAPRPFRVPGYPVTPLLFIVAAAAIVLNQIVSQPRNSAIGIGMVLLGAPVYLAWRRKG